MIKRLLFFLLILGKAFIVECAPASDSLFETLRNTIESSPKYDAEKIAEINALKLSLQFSPKNDLKRQYQIIRSL